MAVTQRAPKFPVLGRLGGLAPPVQHWRRSRGRACRTTSSEWGRVRSEYACGASTRQEPLPRSPVEAVLLRPLCVRSELGCSRSQLWRWKWSHVLTGRKSSAVSTA